MRGEMQVNWRGRTDGGLQSMQLLHPALFGGDEKELVLMGTMRGKKSLEELQLCHTFP